jgi:hypothetical protein
MRTVHLKEFTLFVKLGDFGQIVYRSQEYVAYFFATGMGLIGAEELRGGNARESVESSNSRVTHSKTPLPAWQAAV